MTLDSPDGSPMPAAATRAIALQRARAVLAVASVAAVAGCARPDWTDPERSKGSRALPPPPARKAIPVLDAPPPPWPKWVAPLIGKPLHDVYPREGACVGNTDAVAWRYTGEPARAVIVGWAWDVETKRPAPRIVLADAAGVIVGGGRSGVARPDVTAAMPNVTATNTGWQALAPVLGGRVLAYGVIDDGRAVCALGGLDF
jgi:hypothetical protein